MALEFLGGAFISSVVGGLCDRLISWASATCFTRKRKHDDDGRVVLDRLELTLLGVRPLVNDAEVKKLTNSVVKEWMDELQYVLYQADDLQDEIATNQDVTEGTMYF